MVVLGVLKFRCIGLLLVGGFILIVMLWFELLGFVCVNIININWVSWLGLIVNLDSMLFCILSLLFIVVVVLVKNVFVSIMLLNLLCCRWIICLGVVWGGSVFGDKLFSVMVYFVFYFVSVDYILLLLLLLIIEFFV